MLFPFCKFFKILREKSEVCGEKILFDSERIIINTPHDKKEIGCGLDFLREKIISLYIMPGYQFDGMQELLWKL